MNTFKLDFFDLSLTQSSANLSEQTNDTTKQLKIMVFRFIKKIQNLFRSFILMQNQKYIPVDCGFYDNLEAFATTKKTVTIRYLKSSYDTIIHQKIKVKDLETKNGEEFMIFEVESTKEKIKIRLDRLIDIDGITVPKNGESCLL
ncbi:hypothetical protein [Bernardetia sp. MNP-M8]|uniref:hypothetical protein n=1 Tax=Bernardetia sp. MNP-M8 TaxID=3127470 RepID=UPI0030CD347E